MWLGIGSIMMMFAGLTSALIVKKNQAQWFSYDMPQVFWFSSLAIILSSITLIMAGRSFRDRRMQQYRLRIAVTAALGLVFLALQAIGFVQLWNQGLTVNATVSVSFLYVIVGLHALHVLGGVVALIVLALRAYSKRTKFYGSTPVQLLSMYWHFVDVLWLYLLVFLMLIR
jgi:cytochrome c oxidase subunit 3